MNLGAPPLCPACKSRQIVQPSQRRDFIPQDPAAQRFQQALAGLSSPHPEPGLRLTYQQFLDAIDDDPDGYEAWSQLPHHLHLRPDRAGS